MGVARGIAVRVALLGHGHRDDPRLICVVHVGEGDLSRAGREGLAAREELGRAVVLASGDGQNGLVVPVGDIEAFADALALLQGNPQVRGLLATEAMRTIRDEGYLVDTMFERYLALFREVAAAPSLRIPGPVVPPLHLRGEGTLAAWARRVASDPLASAGRVVRRLSARSP